MKKDAGTTASEKRTSKVGLPPGTLVYTGNAGGFDPIMEQISFNSDHFSRSSATESQTLNLEEDKSSVHWITLFGIHQNDPIERLGQMLSLHPLLLEDVLNVAQRPNAELYEDTFFLSLKMLRWDEQARKIHREHLSMVLQEGKVILFQEVQGDIFDDIRQRLELGKGLIRMRGADYLFYRLIDTCVDEFFPVLEHYTRRLLKLESEILSEPIPAHMTKLVNIKKQLLALRADMLPLRDHVTLFERLDRRILHKDTVPYIRDLASHIREVIETIDLQRETVAGLIDLYMSASNQQLSNVMRVLTVIATIFIPLTFVVGIYGMNFDHMPELHTTWGYPLVWAIMIAITLGLLAFFKRKKWL